MTEMAIDDFSTSTLTELIGLSGRTALVTGGAAGIGLQTAVRFAEAGATLAIADLDGQAAARAARDIGERYGTKCLGLQADIADEHSVMALFKRTVEEFGRLDILVNNAGISSTGKLLVDTTLGEWEKVQAVNLRGTFLCARAAASQMQTAGTGGVIVNLASTVGFVGMTGVGSYVASKHGVVGLTKALALELGLDRIRVVGVAPAATLTNMLARLIAVEGAEQALAHSMALGRVGRPDDVARVVLFAASDLAGFISGVTIPVDGGMLAGSMGNANFAKPNGG